jgi:receptor protein-tyrosine kinase
MNTNDTPFRANGTPGLTDDLLDGPNQRSGQRSLGAILVAAGRLDANATEQILRRQREHGQSFGQAAISLGLLTSADVELGLARQFDFPYLLQGTSLLSQELVLAYQPFGAQAETMRVLRSELMQRWFGRPGQHALAITSAHRHEGRSYLAANLAITFSQLGQRTLLIDADLRQPRQHALFGQSNSMGLSALLSGRAGQATIARIDGLVDLSVLSAGTAPPNPAELLARPAFGQLLQELARNYDVVLIDTPPATECVDARSVAASAGAALVLARKDVTALGAVTQLASSMGQAGIAVLGSVLNEF